jgi:hypothetical protein
MHGMLINAAGYNPPLQTLQGYNTAALYRVMAAVTKIEQAVSNGQQLLGAVRGLLRVLAGVRSVPASTLPADQHQVSSA